MKKLIAVFIMLLMIFSIDYVLAEDTKYASGFVFHDTNQNARLDPGEKGLQNIKVSNGRDVVTTDDSGKYSIAVDDNCIIFVIKPRDWSVPLDNNGLSKFYYIHKPNGSPELKYPGVAPTGDLPKSIDFPLYRQDEPIHYHALFLGDTQPSNQTDIDYLAHDVVEELIGTDATFGVVLGDIMNDNLSFFDSLNATMGLVGIPWVYVMGNHDRNYDAKTPEYSDETFERIYGPSHYSFDYGQVHFVVLYDVMHNFEKQDYTGGIGEENWNL